MRFVVPKTYDFLVQGGLTKNIELHPLGEDHPIYLGECRDLTDEQEARNRYLKLGFYYPKWIDMDDSKVLDKLPLITITKGGVVIKQYPVDQLDLTGWTLSRIFSRKTKEKRKRK